MTRSKKLRILRETYAKVPSANCRGLCAASCSTIPVHAIELELLEATTGRAFETMPVFDPLVYGNAKILGTGIGQKCPLLVLDRCSVYADRPLICRAFGAVDGMMCPHGCEPDRVMTGEEMKQHLRTIRELE
jgi:Fe-S-cluster containining protein